MNEFRRREREQRRERLFTRGNDQGHLWGGMFLLLIGVAALAKNYIFGYDWLFSWPSVLIVVGIFVGLKSRFRGVGWLIMIFVGGYFLASRFTVIGPEVRKLFWPIALILLGAMLILRPKKRFDSNCMPPFYRNKQNNFRETETDFNNTESSSAQTDQTAEMDNTGNTSVEEEVLDVVAVFSAVKKNIYSKHFRGGEVVCVFGGAEINLTQANFQTQTIIIESVQVFGGAKLIIPADWVIHNEAVAIFGGIEDKRPQVSTISTPNKVLILKGFAMFGGIEIKSY